MRSIPTTCADVRRASWIVTPAVPAATSRIRAGCSGYDPVDHRPAPPAVLPEREHLREPVVAVGEPVEQLLGEAVRIGGGRRRHGGPLSPWVGPRVSPSAGEGTPPPAPRRRIRQHRGVLVDFYTVFSTVCFTLLGLWLIVVQTRHAEWRQSSIHRRRAYGVSL